MAKSKTIYACQHCAAQHSKWAGQCDECGKWNTLVEEAPTAVGPSRGYAGEVAASISKLSEVALEQAPRTSSGLIELDRVLGGGLVSGSVVLIGGDPGIGKSTILLQSSCHLAQKNLTLYVTGEESLQQVTARARRLGLPEDQLKLYPETQVETIINTALREKPKFMVIDSIQTLFTSDVQSAPGSVSQVRESAARLVAFAKKTGTTIYLVGHVTKDGALAGPRVLEHMVDTVLYFEGDPGNRYRVIRAAKNRFGAVNEIGIFAMTEKGLREVTNPSAIFLTRYEKAVSGSVVLVAWEGSRPMLVEVQALVDQSYMPNPRRVCVGLEQNRLSMLLAVLNRHGHVSTADQDVFVNVVGGVRVSETSADLALLLAALSSMKDKPLPQDLIVFGEVGLSGEVRPVQNGQDRLQEAAKHGFKRAIVPTANVPKNKIVGLEIFGVNHLSEAMAVVRESCERTCVEDVVHD